MTDSTLDPDPKEDDTDCLNPECDRARFVRGLCSSCYTIASRLVKKGMTSWSDLIAAGRALEAHKGGARPVKQEWFLEGIRSGPSRSETSPPSSAAPGSGSPPRQPRPLRKTRPAKH